MKTSSLGDIIQSFVVLEDLKRRFPDVLIDWVVETRFSSLVKAHPLVNQAIEMDIKGRKNFKKAFIDLRAFFYDIVFDFQANCKSGVITFFSRAKYKVGYGIKSVREWPNVLATNFRFDISKGKNIRLFYLELIEKFFNSPFSKSRNGISFQACEKEMEKVQEILSVAMSDFKIMVCPGAKWKNKQLSFETWNGFLQKIEREYRPSFFFCWGTMEEKKISEKLAQNLFSSFVFEKLEIATWQNLMNEMDLIIALDSSALHLAATSQAASFSIFGPTRFEIFKPIGSNHGHFQGKCPYHEQFEKQCPFLRSCSTGACMKSITSEELFEAFQNQRDVLQAESTLRS